MNKIQKFLDAFLDDYYTKNTISKHTNSLLSEVLEEKVARVLSEAPLGDEFVFDRKRHTYVTKHPARMATKQDSDRVIDDAETFTSKNAGKIVTKIGSEGTSLGVVILSDDTLYREKNDGVELKKGYRWGSERGDEKHDDTEFKLDSVEAFNVPGKYGDIRVAPLRNPKFSSSGELISGDFDPNKKLALWSAEEYKPFTIETRRGDTIKAFADLSKFERKREKLSKAAPAWKKDVKKSNKVKRFVPDPTTGKMVLANPEDFSEEELSQIDPSELPTSREFSPEEIEKFAKGEEAERERQERIRAETEKGKALRKLGLR